MQIKTSENTKISRKPTNVYNTYINEPDFCQYLFWGSFVNYVLYKAFDPYVLYAVLWKKWVILFRIVKGELFFNFCFLHCFVFLYFVLEKGGGRGGCRLIDFSMINISYIWDDVPMFCKYVTMFWHIKQKIRIKEDSRYTSIK